MFELLLIVTVVTAVVAGLVNIEIAVDVDELAIKVVVINLLVLVIVKYVVVVVVELIEEKVEEVVGDVGIKDTVVDSFKTGVVVDVDFDESVEVSVTFSPLER